MEETAHRKYYLSPTACKGLLRRAENAGKELPKILEVVLQAQADGLDCYAYYGTGGINGTSSPQPPFPPVNTRPEGHFSISFMDIHLKIKHLQTQ